MDCRLAHELLAHIVRDSGVAAYSQHQFDPTLRSARPSSFLARLCGCAGTSDSHLRVWRKPNQRATTLHIWHIMRCLDAIKGRRCSIAMVVFAGAGTGGPGRSGRFARHWDEVCRWLETRWRSQRASPVSGTPISFTLFLPTGLAYWDVIDLSRWRLRPTALYHFYLFLLRLG